jgi:hypothetical protein
LHGGDIGTLDIILEFSKLLLEIIQGNKLVLCVNKKIAVLSVLNEVSLINIETKRTNDESDL